jgi:hypothetical protein
VFSRNLRTWGQVFIGRCPLKQNGNGARHVRRAKQDYVTACEVEIPIAVEIRHGQKNRAAPGWVNNLGLERAIAIAE